MKPAAGPNPQHGLKFGAKATFCVRFGAAEPPPQLPNDGIAILL